MRSLLAAPLLALLVVARAGAQAPDRPEGIGPEPERALTQYSHDAWDDRHGLPQNSVQAVTQSTDGYLWIGTQEGVVRFDGVRFTVYDRETSPALRRPYVWALAADPDGSVWIGMEEGGLVRHQRGTFTRFGRADGVPSDWISELLVDRRGTLWIGTMDGGLARRGRDGRIQKVDSVAGGPGSSILALGMDHEGGVWAGSGSGLTRLDGPRPQTLTEADGLPATQVLSIAPARGGGMWVGTTKGVARLQGGRVTETFDLTDGLPGWWAVDLFEDAHGSLWVATPKGMARRSAGRIETVSPAQLPRGQVGLLFGDREGSLWMGAAGGLGRLREAPIVPVGRPEGLSSDAPTAILQDRSGDMWVGSMDGGVSRLHGAQVDTFSPANQKLNSNFIYALEELRDGSILVGTGAGISRIRGDDSEYLGPAFPAPQPGAARAILEDRRGRLWVGGFTGLRLTDGADTTYFTQADGLADDFVLTVMEEADGTVWVGTRRGVSRLLPSGRFRTYTTAHGLPDANILALHRGSDGSLWIATGAGLGRLQGDRIRAFGFAQGLCDESLYRVLEDDRGRLWVSGNRGIFSLAIADVDRFQAGRAPSLPCRLYGTAEGMRIREANGAVNPAGWRAADGRLWFPTLAGIAVIDPENPEPRLPQPPVVIEEILADGRALPPGVFTIPAGTERIQIRFTAPTFVGADRVRFRYRMEGAEDRWVQAGSERRAEYTNLAPGSYTFRVNAANASGAWNSAVGAVTLRLAPLWYQTPWARALAFLGAVALLLGLYWMGLHTLQARARSLAVLVEERTRAEARFRELFDNASDAVFTTDLEGRFTALNRRAEELTGIPREEARDLTLRDILPRTDAGERTRGEWLAGTAAARTVEIVARDGSRVPVEVSTRRVEEDGRPVGMQAVARDVRERVALEAQLRQSQKMDAVGRLAGGVAHDFNNLLTIIKGSGDLLLMDLPADDPAREDVEQITAAADRAAGLTRQLLAFSRKQVVQPRVLDLNRVVTGLEPMLRRLIGEDIAVACLTGHQPAPVLADPGQLEQVLVNLVVNARDAMPEGGTITVETSLVAMDDVVGAPVRSPTGRCAVLSVSDTGTGMDAATQARIFEPFFTTKEAGKGTGLGLSTVYGIVRQAEGAVQVVSAPGQGTTFRVYLPCAVEEAGAEVPAAGMPAARGTETILLVEDEDAVRGLAQRILHRQGYTVLEARHGGDALTVAEAHRGPIHLLLTDLVMPQMGGRELSTRIQQLRPGIPVLFTSGYTDDEVLRRGLLDSHQAFVEKPFTAETLARAVRSTLDDRDAARRSAPAA